MTPEQQTPASVALAWSKTPGGAWESGLYLVVERIDDKGWNASVSGDSLLVAAALDSCKAACERHAARPVGAASVVERLREIAGWFSDGETVDHFMAQSVASEHAADIRSILLHVERLSAEWEGLAKAADALLTACYRASEDDELSDQIDDAVMENLSAALTQGESAETENGGFADTWNDFEGEHLTDGKGYATADVYRRCREAMVAAWPQGREAATAAALTALSATQGESRQPTAWLYTENRWKDGPRHRLSMKRQAISDEDINEFEITETALYALPAAPTPADGGEE